MRKAHVLSRLSETRTRAILALGAVLALSVTGTFAFWTDSVAITGQSLVSGKIDLQVGSDVVTPSDSFTTTTLGITGMVPGNSVAQIIVLRNHGDVPLKWTAKGGISTGSAAAFSADGALLITITDGAPTGTAPARTCTAGSTQYVTAVPLTSTLTTDLIPTRQASIAGNDGTKTLCMSIKLKDTADQVSLSGNKTTIPSFTFTGTSDIS